MKNKAFTLLELLVVITIIGILSSIVVVSMSGSTDSATIAKGKAYAQQVHALLGANAVGVWNFDEGIVNTCSPTQDACDISGYNNHGTFVGDTKYVDSDIEGYTLSFDGSGDYVDISNKNNFKLTTYTIEAWIKPISVSGQHGIFSTFYYKASQMYYGYTFRQYDAGLQVANVNGGGWGVDQQLAVSGIITINTWTYAVATYNGITATIYKNGVQMGQGTTTAPTFNDEELHGEIACMDQSVGFSNFFAGFIDEVRIYSEALPATEIQKHYVQGLNKLLVNQAITKAEYDQRMEEFNQSLVQNRF